MNPSPTSPPLESSPPDEKDFRRELDNLLRTDNGTNFLFIARAWLILIVAIGGFIAFDLWRAEAGWHLLWDLPLLLVAILVVGASQHQLAGGGHEGTHYILFKNRTLNEIVSDWFCMFPILTSTSTYRKQHLAHHLHVNDPAEDPDLAQLKSSGHDFEFPMPPRRVISLFLRQLLPSNLIRYTLHRARYSAVGMEGEAETPRTSIPSRLFFPYFLILFAVLGVLAHLEVPARVHVLATVCMGGIAAMVLFVSSRESKPGASPATAGDLQRYAHATTVLLALTLLHVFTGLETLTYYALLWLLPLVTSFSFFMMLRQTIQHGNCDQGRFSNTRVFLVNPLLRYAVFPFGMDYHLPHHLYATVPHYRLHALHELLQDRPSYRHRGVVVKGCFEPVRKSEPSPAAPSVVAALGAEYSLKAEDGQQPDDPE